MPPLSAVDGERRYVIRSFVRPLTHCALRDISVHSGAISMKLGTTFIIFVAIAEKVFKVTGSKVKVTCV